MQNPQELLIKSTDTDGTNEASKTTKMYTVPTVGGVKCVSDKDDGPTSEVTSKPVAKPTESSLETSKAESPNKGRRVSRVQLPLHNPQELLIKSTDTDGTNETSKTAKMDEVPTGDAHEDDSEQDDGPT